MSDFFSLGEEGITDGRITTGGGGASDEQLGVEDQQGYPVSNPSDTYSSRAAATAVPWFYNPGLHQEERQFFRVQRIPPPLQDLYAAAASADWSSLRGWGRGRGGVGLGIGGSGVGGGIGGRSCQDCGNQAKKDCVHLRCRKCCMSRGFNCPTHVKSTWVPAAKRRERQQQLVDLKRRKQVAQVDSRGQKFPFGRHGQRDTIPTAVACPRMASNNTSPGLEVQCFPEELSTSAVFTCIRISSADDPNHQFAYQTAISIGGHVFKGILYDHGCESAYFNMDAVTVVGRAGGNTNSSSHVVQPLNLITASLSVAAAGTSRNAAAFIDPSKYAAVATSSMQEPTRPVHNSSHMKDDTMQHKDIIIFESCNTNMTQTPGR